jgi:hypothetical protein
MAGSVSQQHSLKSMIKSFFIFIFIFIFDLRKGTCVRILHVLILEKEKIKTKKLLKIVVIFCLFCLFTFRENILIYFKISKTVKRIVILFIYLMLDCFIFIYLPMENIFSFIFICLEKIFYFSLKVK